MLITYKDSFHGNHFSALVSVDLLGYYSVAREHSISYC